MQEHMSNIVHHLLREIPVFAMCNLEVTLWFRGRHGRYRMVVGFCPSPLKLWVWIPLMARCIRYNIMW